MATLIVPAPALLSGRVATSPSVPHLIRRHIPSMKRSSAFVLIMVIALLLAPMIANAAPSPTTATLPSTPPAGQQTVKSPDAACALLDDAQARATMSGMFETKLLLACGRANELGGVTSDAPANYAPNFGTDVLVNNPALDSGSSRTQNFQTFNLLLS